MYEPCRRAHGQLDDLDPGSLFRLAGLAGLDHPCQQLRHHWDRPAQGLERCAMDDRA